MILQVNWKKMLSLVYSILWFSIGLILVNERPIYAQSPENKNGELKELYSIGEKVAKALLAKNTEAVLNYDRSDLVEEDRKLLSNKNSDLYCYLFDTSCITWKGRSVYDVLHNARQLGIVVKDLKKGSDGHRYGLILFFDRSTISDQMAISPDFLCKKGGKEIITWTFRYVNGKWESSHPPFDAETDVYCNP